MKKNRVRLTLIILILCLGQPSVFGVNKSYEFLDTETFLEMETIRSPMISPNGKHIIFVRGWVDKMNDRFSSNLWIVDSEGIRVRELTHGSGNDFSPVWSPDGKKIAFLSDRDGTTQIHVLFFDTREVAQLTHLERTPSDLSWSPDGKMIAFALFVPDKRPVLSVKPPKFPKGAKLAEPPVIVDRLAWRSDGRGFLPKGHTHIFVIDAELGGTPGKLTSGDYSHRDPQWSHDGKKIFFSAVRKPDAEYLRGDSEIYSVDLGTHEIMALTDRKGPDREARISPDGQWIVYTGHNSTHNFGNISNLYLMDVNGGKKRVLDDDPPDSPSSVNWAPDSSGIYYLMGEKGESNLCFISVDGNKKKITEGIQYLSGLSIAGNGQVAAVRSTFYKPGDLVIFDLNESSRMKKLVDVNEDVLAHVKLGEVEEMWFKSHDGLELQGWLIKPVEFDPSKKYPLVLCIHGGPVAMFSVSFSWSWQNFAASGYAVFYMNPRGSTGYGQDFVDGIKYFYPGKDFDDLMTGVDAVIAKGFIDEENLFVCGGSGGGTLTLWSVGHTDRFRAAVALRPVTNWHSLAGTTDRPVAYYHHRKLPWEDPMEYALRSPLHYVSKVTTPTMIMTGEADLRTPMSQSEEYYRALKMLKKETLLVRVPGEFHRWRRPSHRILQQLYLRAWFEKYMVKR